MPDMHVVSPPPESPGPDALWTPPGVTLESLPAPLRLALREIFSPAYRELVLEAPTSLERTSGLSYLFVHWMEYTSHYWVQSSLWERAQGRPDAEAYGEAVGAHLRLVAVRDRV